MGASRQLRAGTYDRESKDSIKSKEDQSLANEAAVADNGWELVGRYSDGASASRFGTKVRKDWNRLLADLDAGLLDVIATWEPSRADRTLETWVMFVARCRTRGVLVHLTGEEETLDPRQPRQWKRLIDGGVDAAMESEKTSARVLRGVASAAEKGGFHGQAPYGYLRVIVGWEQTRSGPRAVREQREDPETAPVVRDIFKRVAGSEPLVKIVAGLNAAGIAPPGRASQWNRNTVRKLAQNVAYIGQRVHKGQTYEAAWEPLVEVDLFGDACAVLAMPNRKTTKPGRLKYLLSYLALAPCGGQMRVALARPGHAAFDRYGCPVDGCTSIELGAADEYVTRAVVEWISQPGARDLLVIDDEPAQQARGEAAALRLKLGEARDKVVADQMSLDSFSFFERALLPQIEAADQRSVSRGTPLALLALLDAAEVAADQVRPVWDELPMAARREVLALVFPEIRVGSPTVRLSRSSTDQQRYSAAAARIRLR